MYGLAGKRIIVSSKEEHLEHQKSKILNCILCFTESEGRWLPAWDTLHCARA